MARVILFAAFLLIAAISALHSPPVQAAGGTFSIGSATVAPGGQVTVDLTVTPDPETAVGAVDLYVNYDQGVLMATNCTSLPGPCIPQFDPDTVRFVWASVSGLAGVQGSITFDATGGPGTSSVLDLVVFDCADTEGSPIDCHPITGEITVVEATPTPTPTPASTPTITPGPTATPPPQLTQGNVDCSTTGPAVSSVDALKVLRIAAQLPVSQTQPCPVIGSFFYWTVFGNVDCSTTGPAVSAVDALKILRSVALLPLSQTEPCPNIGAPIGTEPPPVSPPESPPILGQLGTSSGAIGGAAIMGILATGLTLGFLRVMNRKRDPGDLEV